MGELDEDISELAEEAEKLGYECREGRGYWESDRTFCSLPGTGKQIVLSEQYQ